MQKKEAKLDFKKTVAVNLESLKQEDRSYEHSVKDVKSDETSNYAAFEFDELSESIVSTLKALKKQDQRVQGLCYRSNEMFKTWPLYELDLLDTGIDLYVSSSNKRSQYSYDFASKTYTKDKKVCDLNEKNLMKEMFFLAFKEQKQNKASLKCLISKRKKGV